MGTFRMVRLWQLNQLFPLSFLCSFLFRTNVYLLCICSWLWPHPPINVVSKRWYIPQNPCYDRIVLLVQDTSWWFVLYVFYLLRSTEMYIPWCGNNARYFKNEHHIVRQCPAGTSYLFFTMWSWAVHVIFTFSDKLAQKYLWLLGCRVSSQSSWEADSSLGKKLDP